MCRSLLILIGICQPQAFAFHAGTIAKIALGLVVAGSASLWVEEIAFKLEEKEIKKDPKVGLALKLLNENSSSQIRFTSGGQNSELIKNGEDSVSRREYVKEVCHVLEPNEAYSMAKDRTIELKLVDKRIPELPIRDCKVCRIHEGLDPWDECVAVECIQTWGDLAMFLEHVRRVRPKEAFELFDYPALRRLKSRVKKS